MVAIDSGEDGGSEAAEEEEELSRTGDPGASAGTRLDPWVSGRWDEMQRKRLSNLSSSSSFSSLGHRTDEAEAQSGDAGDIATPRHHHRSSFSSKSSAGQHSIIRAVSSARSLRRVVSFPHEDAAIKDLSDIGLSNSNKAIASLGTHILPEKQMKERRLRGSLLYTSNLAHLATFGILGVLIRYGLEVLYGTILEVTNDKTPLFRDIIPNMVGSYFMGCVGIVLKKEISTFSEPLAIGLSTGLMGSITTFASWNQKMVGLLAVGKWASALTGYVAGMELAQMSLLVGIATANFLKWTIRKIQKGRTEKGLQSIAGPAPDNFRRQIISLTIFLFLSGSLWTAAVILTILDDKSRERRILWLGCVVGPPGVWTRWHLACLNGKGLGSKFIWLPVGTLLANLIAAALEAALSVVLLAVSNDGATVVCNGLMLGFLGCMSTVSTFVTEVYTMYGGPKQSRAFAYVFFSLFLASLLGIVIYCVPSWAKNYVKW